MTLYFACDRCMHAWDAPYVSECPACGHEAVWEWLARTKRDQHVRDHARLFRRRTSA